MKVKELIIEGVKQLKQNNILDANTKAKVLLQYVLNVDRNYLLIYDEEKVEDKIKIEYMKYIQDVIKGKPMQYITKSQEFMGMNFYVDENVLIPQPDTEILVEEAISHIKNKQKLQEEVKVLDLCTGNGAVAVSIAKYFGKNDSVKVYGSDISVKALDIAKKNAHDNGSKVMFICSDMFKKMENMKFDVIVSNPPYIETEEIEKLSQDVRNEPHIALDGGKDGLDFYRIICKESSKYLKDDSVLLLEIGYNQRQSVTNLFSLDDRYHVISCIKDLSGNDRVVVCKFALTK